MKPRSTVQVGLHARRDLEIIADFVSLDSPTRAEQIVEDLISAMKSLAVFPRRGGIARESPVDGLQIRVLNHGPYRILYHIEALTVTVVRVRHGARKPLTHLDED
jgi:plasmid stabilization system protein ParE